MKQLLVILLLAAFCGPQVSADFGSWTAEGNVIYGPSCDFIRAPIKKL